MTAPEKPSIRTRHFSFAELEEEERAPGWMGQHRAQLMLMYRRAREKERPVILELGTRKGRSTTAFLQACEETDGRLVSVDIKDCSAISGSPRWTFVRSDSTDVEKITAAAPHLREGIDILYIDSLHTRAHVEREITGWYPHLREGAWIFFDDVDSNPYQRGNRKDNYRAEVVWDEIHEFVKAFFHSNEDTHRLSIVYGSTGLACLHKLSPLGATPFPARPLVHRRKTLPNTVKYALLRLLRNARRRAQRLGKERRPSRRKSD